MASIVHIYFTFPRLNITDNNLMLFLLLVISFFFLSIFFTATLFLTYKKIKRLQELENYAKALKGSLSAAAKTTGPRRGENDPAHFAESLLFEILPSKSAKWRSLLSEKRREGGEDPKGSCSGKDKEQGGGGGAVKVQDKVVTDKGGPVQEKVSVKTVRQRRENDSIHLAESLLIEILPSKSAKWRSLLKEKRCEGEDSKVNGSVQDKDLSKGVSFKVQGKVVTDKDGPVQGKLMDKAGPVQEKEEDKGEPVQEGSVERGEVGGEEKRVVKKKKKKGKKKNRGGELKGGDENGMMVMGEENGSAVEMSDLLCLCPLTAVGSATQRKIKLLYHEVVKSCENSTLTLSQVVEFTSCLTEAKEELENKAEAIKRKLTIKNALLSKADRSSIERLQQQIYDLERQQKRLEEDACVYNWLQQQLDLSPACKKLLETSAKMELNTKSSKRQESEDTDEFSDISFEELLAQEKKDSFWQKNWKSRMCSR